MDPRDLRQELETFTNGLTRPRVESLLSSESPEVDEVIRYERLEPDMERVAGLLGLKLRRTVPRQKAETRAPTSRDYRLLYTSQSRLRMAELNEDWIEECCHTF